MFKETKETSKGQIGNNQSQTTSLTTLQRTRREIQLAKLARSLENSQTVVTTTTKLQKNMAIQMEPPHHAYFTFPSQAIQIIDRLSLTITGHFLNFILSSLPIFIV